MFPSHFKPADVDSLLKKPSLPANDLNSYRPISNLSFIFRVLCHLNVQLNCNHLSNVFQSAYKQFHSTETVILKVYNDISLNMDTGKVTALTLLDLSAAFDTNDYFVLLDSLLDVCMYGISGTTLT